jgi:hypothetical protein
MRFQGPKSLEPDSRPSISISEPPMSDSDAVELQSIEESLRRALERQECALHDQPQVNLKPGQITGCGGVDSLAPSHPGPAPSGTVYSRRGRLWAHSPHRYLGAS